VKPLKGLSAAATRQVLVAGRISDSVSTRGIDSAALTLGYDPGTGAFVALPAHLVRNGDGWFAFHLAPELLPQPSGASPAFALAADAAGHDAAADVLAVAKTDLAPANTKRTLAGHEITLVRISGAPFRIDLTLDPLPVGLAGYVFIDGDPEQPAASADVEVVAPPGASTVTGADGSFRLLALPVTAELTIRTTRGGNVRNHKFRPDYSQRINRAVFPTA
jgi:hypothetical protein